MSSNPERVTSEYAHAHSDTENFYHGGRNVWYRGLPPPGSHFRTAVIGPDAAAWKADNMKEKQEARAEAAAALVELFEEAVVKPSLMMRFMIATDGRVVSVKRSLIVRLRLPGHRQALQAMSEGQQDPDDSSTAAVASQNAPTPSPTSVPVSKQQRMAEMISEYTRRATGRKPKRPASSSPSASTRRDGKRQATEDAGGRDGENTDREGHGAVDSDDD